jgi:hypothetical protein
MADDDVAPMGSFWVSKVAEDRLRMPRHENRAHDRKTGRRLASTHLASVQQCC